MEPSRPQIECCEETERAPLSGPLDVASESKQIAEEVTPGRRGRGSGGGRGPPLVGSYVMKNFADGAGPLLGKVVSYAGRFFAAVYEDGRREELDPCEIRRLLVVDAENGASGVDNLGFRKRKLEEVVSAGRTSTRSTRRKVETSTAPMTAAIAAMEATAEELERRSGSNAAVMSGLDLEEDADSSTDSCESACVPASSQPIPLQTLHLPPSSGDIGIPDESVVCLLSVYSFLRSFSLQLFLSPFGLSDFVGSLNCTVQNSLTDAIHVTLLRALRRHLETLSSDGSQVASRCLRYFDWATLDSLTWPVFLLEYLYLMGYIKGQDWKCFYYGISYGEYYGLPATIKLKILQIFCDAVVESAEIRTELETRENMDEERECTPAICIPSQVKRRGRPRRSQIPACKGPEMLDNGISPEESTSSSNKLPADANEPDVAQDGNSDECQLCGMDGTLICCDGCPSAYHSRCIGLIKAFLPDGPWFCPECMANKSGPTFSKIETGIRGADIFGTDPFGRVFLGTCNYLLVLEASSSVEPVSRYYNQNDVLKVLKLLCSTEQFSYLYADICKGIMSYWEIPVNVSYSEPERTDSAAGLLVWKEDSHGMKALRASLGKTVVNANTELENNASNITLSSRENRALSNIEDDYMGIVVNDSLDSVNQADPLNTQKFSGESNEMSANKITKNANDTLAVVKDNRPFPSCAGNASQKVLRSVHEKLSEQFGNESSMSFRLFSQPTELTYSNQQRSAEKSSMLDFEYCASRNGNGAFGDDANSQVLKLKDDRVSMSCESVLNNHVHVVKAREQANGGFILGAFFKPIAYVNQYVLGDIAASAAANLAALALEESRSVAYASYNHRKVVSANIALQLKAFSRATMHFTWTSSEKKLLEAPRERCGWCIACKGASTNKKGCLLNLAAANAIKAAVRGNGGHRPIKNNESHFSAIVTHILHMEETLHGLLVGPLADAKCNKQWRRLVKEASTCRTLKFLLLELERNIRGIAFSVDWFRLLDDWFNEFPVAQVSTSAMVSTHKRGPGRRRKQAAMSEAIPAFDHEDLDRVNWWRGGRVSRALFQRGMLPHLPARKAARQGGLKCVYGINYSESFEIPKRTQQFAWRTAVEMTRSASQLAFQVRCLDAHIRWKDLVRPEQILIEGKATDNEASVFRNAVICEKHTMGNKTRYALAFGDQKRLPVRVTKSILEVESGQDGRDKFWFSESNVPLYLLKEHEEKAKDVALPPSKKVVPWCLPAFQRRQLKSCRRDIFSYLLHKEEKPSKCSCASCHCDVLFRDAVMCNACQGYCHKTCFVPSSAYMEVDLECAPMCNQCNVAFSSALTENEEENMNGQLSFQQENQIDGKVEERYFNPSQLPRVVNLDGHSEMRLRPSEAISEQKAKRGTCPNYGLIWKKKKSTESGEQFRLEHIIPRGGADTNPLRPRCVLCSQDYNPDAMYIRCQHCLNWVHADAVLLEEDQILNLIGYKCSKCRRIRSPKCPYEDPNYKKPERKSSEEHWAGENQGSVAQSLYQIKFKQLPNSVAVEGRHLPSVKRVGSVLELPSEDGSLRSVATAPQSPDLGGHHVYYGDGVHCLHGGAGIADDLREQLYYPEEVNFEGMESEPPQTYFSFTELLASGDDQLDQLLDMPIDNIMSDSWGGAATAVLGIEVSGGVNEDMVARPTVMPTEEHAEEIGFGNLPAVDGVPCQKCGISQPPADLICEICGLNIHRGCAPWDFLAGVASSGGVPWRCVSCRDWE